jgi:PRTRC genetic system ThiF family protein
MKLQNRKTYLSPRFERVMIAGVGGTGSYLAQGLAKMVAGYRLQVDVVLVDPDVVEEKNCARQNFQPWEIGQGKAEALACRLNEQYGLAWGFVAGKGEDYPRIRSHTEALVITCVDKVGPRKAYKDYHAWLDMGNGRETGQALYGTTSTPKVLVQEAEKWGKTTNVGNLPNPYLAFGMARLKDSKKKTASCADTPFAEQGVFANEWAAAAGLVILHQLLVKGELVTPAIYFDTGNGRMSPEFITREYLGSAHGTADSGQ